MKERSNGETLVSVSNGETLVSVYGSRFVKQWSACTRTFANYMTV